MLNVKTIFILLWIICLPCFGEVSPGQAYLERFMAYTSWSQNLPKEPDAAFLAFISADTPLSQKLREKWLYQLALNKDWVNYSRYYKPSTDPSLQCYAILAPFYRGENSSLQTAAKPLWLTGDSQPPACDQLFSLMIKSKDFNENLLTQRLILALDKRNLTLARYLLKQYRQPHAKEEQLLLRIHQSPSRISQLQPGQLQSIFYLYGLKRLVGMNMKQAINYWQSPKTRQMLSTAQQQAFLAQLALYKAMRNHDDAPKWFTKVNPAYYNEILLDWQIRYALKSQHWQQVERLILQHPDKNNPCWQYWLARALEARHQPEKAKEIYASLAPTRHYYGFLASLRLHKKPRFQAENAPIDMRLLKPYQAFIDNIKSLYASKQTLQASRLLNDFASELPKEDKCALAYWISKDLQWHGKSVYLSNNDDMNNQLALRFPLVYSNTVNQHSKNYRVPSELIYAVIRQESAFRDDVVSGAGARGLMQVMPTTAKLIAKTAKIPYGDKAQLFSSQKNIHIGAAYLGVLSKRFDKHFVLMAAAYNAGPRQVNRWLNNRSSQQMDIWIETLPWYETRNYLKNIISFYAVYQYRMNKKTDLSDFMKPI